MEKIEILKFLWNNWLPLLGYLFAAVFILAVVFLIVLGVWAIWVEFNKHRKNNNKEIKKIRKKEIKALLKEGFKEELREEFQKDVAQLEKMVAAQDERFDNLKEKLEGLQKEIEGLIEGLPEKIKKAAVEAAKEEIKKFFLLPKEEREKLIEEWKAAKKAAEEEKRRVEAARKEEARERFTIYFDVEGTLVRGPERARQMLELAREKGFRTVIWTGGRPDDYEKYLPGEFINRKDYNRHIWMAVDDRPEDFEDTADIVIDVCDEDALDVFRHALEQREDEIR